MESIIHFFKHATGLCGESHPSLLVGGAGIMGYCLYCIKTINYKWKSNEHKNIKQ